MTLAGEGSNEDTNWYALAGAAALPCAALEENVGMVRLVELTVTEANTVESAEASWAAV